MNTTLIETIRSNIREVARVAEVPASRILNGDTRIDGYHIARLRGIIASRLISQGLHLRTIAEAFRQSQTCTLEQIRRADQLIRTHPRYERFANLEATRP